MIDDVQMLNHIYQSTQMGSDGIRAVLRQVRRPDLASALRQQLTEYDRLSREAARQLCNRGRSPQPANPLLTANARLTGRIKAAVDPSAPHIAEMMIQGNIMGLNKSIKQLHAYGRGDAQVRNLAEKLRATEESNIKQMQSFLI